MPDKHEGINQHSDKDAADCGKVPCTAPYGKLSIKTVTVHGATLFEPHTGAVSTPIYQSSTFRHPGLYESTGFDYSRAVNPTRSELEKTIALLEHGKYGLAFASGMGAISSVIKLFKPGDHIIVSEDLYGGTYRLFHEYYAKYGFSFSWIDTSNFALVEGAMKSNTRGIFIETPSNPMMKVSDIRRSGDLIHKQQGILIVDNTFLSPYYQTPLDLGADIVVHSGTKYLAGHNDTLAGLLVHSREDLAEPLANAHKSEGATLAPFDAWLVLRGIKTLSIRMEQHEKNAYRIAAWLREHKRVEKVFYTGFEDHPQYSLSKSQSRGFGGMISFYLKNRDDVPILLKNISLILFAESLGGVETLLTYPLVQTHGAIPEEMRLSAGVNDRLMRLSVGIEDAGDLITDLDGAFSKCI
ncbi:cystathionine gamma-lyase [Treponema primitia ZAS-2]|uniref:Cystathionine gamma-lyase n=1 Tax=Treponema primitia (strain ATCC BAA-887 / DSM 12427 / ZAS-2) TaxID=545694 RepID=F5YKL5_TREPZ|nr:PLP-dependent aspartate aminotransferase family protein [Treponema primitia]AEF85447.1 cystathionine gamma-lyase [Treponema primitia ZAS-2]